MTINAKIATLLTLWLIVFYPVYSELFDDLLRNSDNLHGLLVPLICLYLAWQSKDRLKAAEITRSNWGLFLLAASLVIYLLFYMGGIAVVVRLMIVASLAGLVLFNFGGQVFRILVCPILFLIFMVPIPDSIMGMVAFPLQLFATKVSAGIIQAFSIPTYREGNMLYFVQTQLEVAEACSGIRSIMALTMLSVVLVYLANEGIAQKIILLLSAIPVAIAANIVRISGTGILAHFYGDSVARGFLHEFSGIAVFIFGMATLLLEFAILNKFFTARSKQMGA